MLCYGILCDIEFNIKNKDDIKNLKENYDVSTEEIEIQHSQYEVIGSRSEYNKETNGFDKYRTYELDTDVKSGNINDVIDWLLSFEGTIVDVLEVDIDPDDNELTKLQFDKTCYSIKANFIEPINETLINTNNNVLSYKIYDNTLEACITYNSIENCIDWLDEIGTIHNKLRIRKFNLN